MQFWVEGWGIADRGYANFLDAILDQHPIIFWPEHYASCRPWVWFFCHIVHIMLGESWQRNMAGIKVIFRGAENAGWRTTGCIWKCKKALTAWTDRQFLEVKSQRRKIENHHLVRNCGKFCGMPKYEKMWQMGRRGCENVEASKFCKPD